MTLCALGLASCATEWAWGGAQPFLAAAGMGSPSLAGASCPHEKTHRCLIQRVGQLSRATANAETGTAGLADQRGYIQTSWGTKASESVVSRERDCESQMDGRGEREAERPAKTERQRGAETDRQREGRRGRGHAFPRSWPSAAPRGGAPLCPRSTDLNANLILSEHPHGNTDRQVLWPGQVDPRG